MRPLLLLDVDGVLIPFDSERAYGAPITERPAYAGPWRSVRVNGFDVVMSERVIAAAPALAESFEIWWATSWEEGANEALTGILGWPALPVVPIYAGMRAGVRRWEVLAEHVPDDRDLAWCDDTGITPAARRWAATRTGRTLLCRPRRTLGLTPRQCARLLRFGTAAS